MRVYVGTSGFAYKEWKGSFYPEDLPADAMLAYYGERLDTVEINNTFYRMPTEKVLLQWAEQVPAEFRFILKASRRITHSQRLKEVGDPVAYLYRTAACLGERLGPILFQLPPNLKVDLPRLETFLELLPADSRAALEFRNPSWHDDAVYNALRRHNVAMCIADTGEETTPFVATADWGYLRLRRVEYGDSDLGTWADRVAEQQWHDAFVFFKHEEAGTGPRLAAEFRTVMEGSRHGGAEAAAR
ncbi:MAG: DUF72 domain-containing protein [Longimicrobiales bacterium]